MFKKENIWSKTRKYVLNRINDIEFRVIPNINRFLIRHQLWMNDNHFPTIPISNRQAVFFTASPQKENFYFVNFGNGTTWIRIKSNIARNPTYSFVGYGQYCLYSICKIIWSGSSFHLVCICRGEAHRR